MNLVYEVYDENNPRHRAIYKFKYRYGYYHEKLGFFVFHNENGHAVEWIDGLIGYYHHGVCYSDCATYEEFLKQIKYLNF
jgi:hypothetical protein